MHSGAPSHEFHRERTDAVAHPPRTPEQQARLDAEIHELMERRITFNQTLGVKVLTLRPSMSIGFAMRPELVGHFHYGRLHGGVIAAVLDTLGGGALMVAAIDRHPNEPPAQAMGRFERFGTVDLRVEYLRPGLGANFVAQAEVTRLGRRLGSVLLRLHNDEGALIATGSGTYVMT